MAASNGGSTLPNVPEGQTPGPGHGGDKQPLTGAMVFKSAPSNLTPNEPYNNGMNPYAPGGKK